MVSSIIVKRCKEEFGERIFDFHGHSEMFLFTDRNLEKTIIDTMNSACYA